MFHVYMLPILNIIYVNMLSYTGYTYILIYTYQVMYVIYVIHNICTPIYTHMNTQMHSDSEFYDSTHDIFASLICKIW